MNVKKKQTAFPGCASCVSAGFVVGCRRLNRVPEGGCPLKKKTVAAGAALLVCAIVLCFFLLRGAPSDSRFTVLVDGAPLSAPVLAPEKGGGLRVILTLDGREIANLPFGEAHTVRVEGENGFENTLRISENSVRMESANCDGQDCVKMEEITRDNLETRVMQGMIICLPHRLCVEVR